MIVFITSSLQGSRGSDLSFMFTLAFISFGRKWCYSTRRIWIDNNQDPGQYQVSSWGPKRILVIKCIFVIWRLGSSRPKSNTPVMYWRTKSFVLHRVASWRPQRLHENHIFGIKLIFFVTNMAHGKHSIANCMEINHLLAWRDSLKILIYPSEILTAMAAISGQNAPLVLQEYRSVRYWP